MSICSYTGRRHRRVIKYLSVNLSKKISYGETLTYCFRFLSPTVEGSEAVELSALNRSCVHHHDSIIVVPKAPV